MPERRVSLKDLIVSVARRRRSIRVAVLVVREGGSWTLIVNTYVFFAFNVVPQPQPNRLVAWLCLSVLAGAKQSLPPHSP